MDACEAREQDCSRLGKCEVCGKGNARYTCPRCELKTCCKMCVSIHKEELECNGERDKTRYVPLSKYDNLTLLSDYRFLEDITRTVERCKSNPLKKSTRYKRLLPPHLWKLRVAAMRNKTTLHFLPQHFTRHRDNTTMLDFRTKVISWRVEFVFPHGNEIRIPLDRCKESDRLSFILSKLIEFDKCPDEYKERLKFYHSCGLAGIEVLLKAENVRGSNYYYLMDLSLTLRENLENRTIIETPVMYVIMRHSKEEYNILDPDKIIPENNDAGSDNQKGKFPLFHYFDGVSYTNQVSSCKSESSFRSIRSSVAELKKYFASSEVTDEETDEDESPPDMKATYEK